MDKDEEKYLMCFKEAMGAIDRAIVNGKKPTRAYRKLVREGYWRPDYMAFQFTMCYSGLSSLPKSCRDYILSVGALAKEIFEKASAETEKE